MADLTIVPAQVAPVQVFEQVTLPAGEAIDAGEVVRLDVSTGYATLANASSAAEGRMIGIAINSAVAGQAVTIVKRGLVSLGDALDSQTLDELLAISNTDGKIDDGVGTPTADYNVGRIWPAHSAVTVDFLLYVDVATHYA